MANRVKGEVAFEAGEQEYVLLLDFNALCDLEDDFPGLMDGQVEFKSPKAIRRVFHAGLAEHHPDLTERDAGRLLHELGLAQAGVVIQEAFKASFPDADAGGEGASRPRKARPGAGSAP